VVYPRAYTQYIRSLYNLPIHAGSEQIDIKYTYLFGDSQLMTAQYKTTPWQKLATSQVPLNKYVVDQAPLVPYRFTG